MRSLIRSSRSRLLIICFGLVILNFTLPYIDANILREGLAKALQASTLLFAVCTALSLAILNSYVKGLKEAALKRISDTRDLIEKLYDEFHESEDPDLKIIVCDYLLPLLSFSTNEWLSFDPINDARKGMEEPLTRIHERNDVIVPRYFLRLEDEINELGILYVRRVISGLHSDTIKGSLLLVCVGIVALVFVMGAPAGLVTTSLAINVSLAIIAFAVLEILLLTSFIMQESEEELPDYSSDDEEFDPGT